MTPASPTRPVERNALFAGRAARRVLSVVFVLALSVCGGALGGASAFAAGPTQFGEPGEGAGQFERPVGVAVSSDPSSSSFGDVYVTDQFINRVDRFSGSGAFQLAWGWGVANGASEAQTCGPDATPPTPTCQGAKETEAAGAAAYPAGVAVDNDPLSPSAGDVYVVQAGGELNRVEKFGPAGESLLMFGGDVNETTGGDVCVAGEKCKHGVDGSADGQFDFHGIGDVYGNSIAVGPGGRVYVGDSTPRVQVFEPSGAWRETISLSGLASTGSVSALAVDEAGDVFVRYGPTELEENGVGLESGESAGGVSGVREFEPGGAERAIQFDAGSTTVTGIALDGSGDLFVGDSKGGFHVLKYVIATGKAVASFGSKTVGEPYRGSTPMAFSEALGDLYVSEFSYPKVADRAEEHFSSSVWVLPLPPPGPSIEAVSGTHGPRVGEATLAARVDPEGHETEYHFEYVTEAEFKQGGFAGTGVVSTPVGSIAESIEPKPLSAQITGLTLSTTYHYRLLAKNAEGEPVPVEGTFETLPAADIDSEFATDVSLSSATMNADVNPLGASTTYRFEYGTSTSYGQMVTGSVGEGVGDVLVSYHRQELLPDTKYHYRIVVHNSFGTIEGADRTFTTQLAGEEMTLPDDRAWELVSPAAKGGALIQPLGYATLVVQAAAHGSAIAYEASAAVGEDPVSKPETSEVLSVRGADGWRSEDISRPIDLPTEGTPAESTEEVGASGYQLLSSELSLAAVEPVVEHGLPLSAEATERTPYLRNDLTCETQPESCYAPLVDPHDVEPSSIHFGGNGTGIEAGFEVHVVGGTSDLSHVVLTSPSALTADASSGTELGVKGTEGFVPEQNLYEWSDGQLQVVNILPGKTSSTPGAYLGYRGIGEEVVAHTVSSDGRFIVWSNGGEHEPGKKLFVRDMLEKRTVEIGGGGANFQTMSRDGSRVFFRENGELYELNVETDTSTDLTANHGVGEASAGVRDAILGSSEEGCDIGAAGECDVYFVAKGVLAGVNIQGHAPVGGEDNLYVLHDGAGDWSTIFIATLSSEDEHSWYGENFTETNEKTPCDCWGVERSRVSSRVSPNGRYVTFMSEEPLTGYDNIDAVSSQPDEEVFLYDVVTKRLVCVSCNPTGARPVGVLDGHHGLLVDPGRAWAAMGEEGSSAGEHWLAGMIPSWLHVLQGDENTLASYYQPRFLSNGGRLFFDSPDGLVPQATNGLMNVYEYEPAVGADGTESSAEAPPNDGCSTTSSTYSERSAGCVSLISGGTSGSESMFYDASESGDDVFFITASRLVPEDVDSAYDVYDARVCTSEAPCPTVPVSPPLCNSGDSCKAAPSPQPEIFGAPPSATFVGAGNLVPSSPVVKSKRKASKCVKGKTRNKHGKCVEARIKRKARKAKRASNDRRTKS